MIRLYFLSDTGAAYLDADTDVQARAATAKFLRTMPDYRECTREEWQAKRRWQQRQDKAEAEVRE